VERIAAEHRGERILIVSHGGSLRALHRHALKVDSVPRLENCAVYKLAFRDGVLSRID
jgi:broad specificity phosphatase PhoE